MKRLFNVARMVSLLALTAATALVSAGCSDETRVCYPDDYRSCVCGDGRRGYQACAQDSSAFGACDCSVGFPSVDGGPGTTSSSASSGGYQTGT